MHPVFGGTKLRRPLLLLLLLLLLLRGWQGLSIASSRWRSRLLLASS
jgi:hypothetical protein